ncbi:MAG TPA: metalloregulator ArsR/SmtB family transcription factor [Gemmatimonadales bacterium]|nr:metalloregulator ArsR/SmtB family transcription factor [Gemmatimonadales bacterium]
MAYDAALAALADPTRRALFERLRRRPHTVGELARIAGIQQPTVSQHLQVLRAAKLVTDRREGTRRFYRAHREGLAELREYLESLWDDVLAAYAASDPHPNPRQGSGTKRRRS